MKTTARGKLYVKLIGGKYREIKKEDVQKYLDYGAEIVSESSLNLITHSDKARLEDDLFRIGYNKCIDDIINNLYDLNPNLSAVDIVALGSFLLTFKKGVK